MKPHHAEEEHMPRHIVFIKHTYSTWLHNIVANNKYSKEMQVRKKISTTKQNCQLLAGGAHYLSAVQT